MTVIPSYDLLLLPGVTYYFQEEYIRRNVDDKLQKGEKVLFALLKEDKDREDMLPEDFYPIGAVGTVLVSSEDSVGIHIDCRVDLDEMEVVDHEFVASACERPDYPDVSEEDHKKRLDSLKDEVLNFIQQFPWGIMARRYVQHWATMEDAAVALGSYLGNSNEDKYAILAADYRSERIRLIEEAVWKMMSFMQVGKDVEQQHRRQI